MGKKFEKEHAAKLDRRQFLTGTAVGALAAFGAGVLPGCAPSKKDTDVSDKGDAAKDANSWLGEAPKITDADCSQTIDTEVLVIGAGDSGWFAACAAAEAGAKTLLVERNPAGSGVRGSALGAVGSRKQKEVGAVIDPVEITNDYIHYADNQADMRLMRLWTDNSGEALDWYCDRIDGVQGCKVDLEYNMPPEGRYKAWPTGHGTSIPSAGSGREQRNAEATVVKILTAYFEGFAGCSLKTSTTMLCLIKESDKVVGIYATDENNQKIRINASKGVIVATGGYANNKDMYTALQGDLAKSLDFCIAFPGVQGDGIKACMWAGAAFDDQKTSMIFDRGTVPPNADLSSPYDMTGAYCQFASQPFLKVDANGNRICNESSPYDYVVHAAALRPGRAWYPIWDASWQSDVHRFHTVGCSTLEIRDGGNQLDPVGLDATAQMLDQMAAGGLIIKANTLDELAKGLGITDAAAFKATITQYNTFYDNQNDAQFSKEPYRLSAIKTAPFYGMKVGGILLCTLDGIRIDTQFRALDANAQPIEGLYVVGNDSGGYYAHTYPNLGAGSNAGRCATFGRMCGKQVAAR